MRRGAEKPCAKYLPAMQVAQGFSSRHAITQRFVRRNDMVGGQAFGFIAL